MAKSYQSLWDQLPGFDTPNLESHKKTFVIHYYIIYLSHRDWRQVYHVPEFINIWCVSINQMEASRFLLPGNRQLLSIFADGLPNNTVAFINLYDNIILSLNESNEQFLPNIHQLFDCTVHIKNNVQHIRTLNHTTWCPQTLTLITPSTQPPISPTTGLSSSATQATPTAQSTTPLCCSNCGHSGHNTPTCFQPGGAMEGWQEEHLASRIPKLIAHIVEVEEQTDVEEGTIIVDENALNNELLSSWSVHGCLMHQIKGRNIASSLQIPFCTLLCNNYIIQIYSYFTVLFRFFWIKAYKLIL